MALIFTIQESAGNLIMSGSGTMDLTGFNNLGTAGSVSPYIQASGFASGFTSQQVLIKLTRFNAI